MQCVAAIQRALLAWCPCIWEARADDNPATGFDEDASLIEPFHTF